MVEGGEKVGGEPVPVDTPLSDPPYYIAGNTIMLRGDPLLSGPLLQLEQFCEVLNRTLPAEEALPDTIRALISLTRNTVFQPGERLRAIGRMRRPLRHADGPKRKPGRPRSVRP